CGALAAASEAARQRQVAAAAALATEQAQVEAALGSLSAGQLAAELAALAEKDRQSEELRKRLDNSEPIIQRLADEMNRLREEASALDKDFTRLTAEKNGAAEQLAEKSKALARLLEKAGESATADAPLNVEERIQKTREKLDKLQSRERELREQLERVREQRDDVSRRSAAAAQACESAASSLEAAEANWSAALSRTGFRLEDEVKQALLPEEMALLWQEEIRRHREAETAAKSKAAQAQAWLAGRRVSDEEWAEWETRLTAVREAAETALTERAKAERDHEDIREKHSHWRELERRRAELADQLSLLGKLQTVFRGNAFIDFVAKEQLLQVSRAASERLLQLTRRRYAIEVDSEGCFVIRDDANGGIKRPVGTLSGGETFLTSLALALALSAQIQLSGQYPLEFFFLDEGFGTLDSELLETVVSALERLHMDKLTVGIISHVPELRARLPRRLVVEPAEPGGIGSRIALETQ
ncbi:SbcC/MukB-like Walker B domain-containing protein, partial [Gorillibacterium massiliense]|uniref:SbcC/MukB-like Walker B domain-containing protein n=1 Tax=Gorillibacterium massiliense TaxID=1280390 RepID=UPI00059362B1